MAQTLFSFDLWNPAYTYARYDVVQGAVAGDTRYYYSTTDANLAAKPTAPFYFTPTSTVRTDNVMRVNFTQTGTAFFQQGSMIVISGVTPDSTANYTGICLSAGAGYVEYLNPGLNATNATSAGVVQAPIHPYWTTGFYWIPGYTTDVTHNQVVIRSPMGEGYTQRFNPVINSNSFSWNLVFENRTDKEEMSLANFLQNMGGAAPFVIAFPIGKAYNVATFKYIAGPLKDGLTSFNEHMVSVEIQQVFDL